MCRPINWISRNSKSIVYLFAAAKWNKVDCTWPVAKDAHRETMCNQKSPQKSSGVSGGSRISPRWGANSPGGVNRRFCQIFQKPAWNWKNLDAWGDGSPGAKPPLPDLLMGIIQVSLPYLQTLSGFSSWTLFCQIWQYCVDLYYKM